MATYCRVEVIIGSSLPNFRKKRQEIAGPKKFRAKKMRAKLAFSVGLN
tara:strand:+ start:173 stop:316 length:144 start_codon:yes stop_codon:yes gene_type:complete